jgi:hypothetical protein
VIDTYFADSDIAKVLQLGQFNPAGWKTDAIDTQAESTQLKLSEGKKDNSQLTGK